MPCGEKRAEVDRSQQDVMDRVCRGSIKLECVIGAEVSGGHGEQRDRGCPVV